ncbi:hypothetical protein ACTXJY_00415 [Corynebacterium casei]|uniref:hypothetical protein n=1 Tax=Corynebacterium casei TaxID=160386 RepID=UPI003FD5839D
MKKYLFPIVLAIPLALAACSDTATEEPTPAPSSTSVETTSAAPTGPVEVGLGETINLTQDANGARDIDLTIDDITISDQCHTGLNGHTDEPEDGGYYIRMIGEMDVKQSQTNFSFSETSLTALDEENYTIEVTPAFACNYPNDDLDGYQWFDSPIDEGQKARGVLEFWVADIPEKLSFTEPYEPLTWVWEVPETDGLEESAQQEESAASEEQASEPVIGMTEAPGAAQPTEMNKTIQSCGEVGLHETGTTFFTDGSTGWTEQCSSTMMQSTPPAAAVPSRDESQNVAPEGRYYTQQDLDNGFVPGQ